MEEYIRIIEDARKSTISTIPADKMEQYLQLTKTIQSVGAFLSNLSYQLCSTKNDEELRDIIDFHHCLDHGLDSTTLKNGKSVIPYQL